MNDKRCRSGSDNRTRQLLVAATALGTALLSFPATANPASSTAFNIPREDLSKALGAYSEQANVQLVMKAQDIRGRTARPITGDFPREQALHMMLLGSDIEAVWINDDTVAIKPKPLLRLASASSQRADPAASPPPPPISSPSDTGEIVVMAQKRAERLVDVPISVTAQNAAQLTQAGVVNTADLTRVVPGLTFTFQGAWAQPNIRGISTNVTGPGSDNPIALYLDGVYMGNQIGIASDLPNVDHVEVLKGPQGTLFGRNATGGAIQIFTKPPSFTPTGAITATGGWFTGSGASRSAYEAGLKGYYSGPITDKLAASLSGSYDTVSGYFTNDATGGHFGRIRSEAIRGKLLYQPNDQLSFTLTGYYEACARVGVAR